MDIKRDGLSKTKADAISNGLFLIGIGILFFTGGWWPGILLVILMSLAARQLLTHRFYDAFISTLILGGLFVMSFFRLAWDMILPVLFITGGIYIIFREYLVASGMESSKVKKFKEIEKEIEDEKSDI